MTKALTIGFALVVVVAVVVLNRPHSVTVSIAKHFSLEAGPYSSLVGMVQQVTVREAEVRVNPQAYSFEFDDTAISVRFDENARLSVSDLVFTPNYQNPQSAADGGTLGVNVVDGDVKADGGVYIRLANRPEVRFESINLSTTPNVNNSEVTASLLLANAIASVVAETIYTPAHQRMDTYTDANEWIEKISIDSVEATLAQCAEVDFVPNLQASLSDSSRIAIEGIVYVPQNDSFSATISVNLNLASPTQYSVDTLAIEAADASIDLVASVDYRNGSIAIKSSGYKGPSFALRKCKIVDTNERWSGTSDTLILGLTEFEVAKAASNPKSVFVAEGKLNGEIAANWSDGNTAIEIKKVPLNDLTLKVSNSGESGQLSYVVDATNSFVVTGVQMSHTDGHSSLKIQVPKFESKLSTAIEPSDVRIDVAALLSEASEFEFRSDNNTSIAAVLGSDITLNTPEFAIPLFSSGNSFVEHLQGELSLNGTLESVAIRTSDDKTLKLTNANVSISTKIDDDVRFDCSVNGSFHVAATAVGIKGAKIDVSQLQFALDDHGKLKSGAVDLTVSVPKTQLCSLIQGTLSSELSVPDQTGKAKGIDFRISNTRINPNNPQVTFSVGKFHIKGKPSVHTKVRASKRIVVDLIVKKIDEDIVTENDIDAGFDVAGFANIAFPTTSRLHDQRLKVTASYEQVLIELGGVAGKIPGVADAFKEFQKQIGIEDAIKKCFAQGVCYNAI